MVAHMRVKLFQALVAGKVVARWYSRVMARRPYERLVLFSVSTYGKGGADLGADESEVCLLAWQVIDTAKIQVGINWSWEHMVGCFFNALRT